MAVDLTAPLLAKAAIDIATGDDAAPKVTLTTIVIALVAAALLRYAFQFGRRMSAGAIAVGVQRRLRQRILDTLLHLDGPSRDGISTGQIVSRSISDLQVVQGLLAMTPLSLGGGVQAVLAFGVMAWLSPLLTLIAGATIPLTVGIVYISRRRLFAATWSAQQAASEVASHVEETVTGVRVVKGFGQERRMTAVLTALSGRLYGEKMRTARLNGWFMPTMSAVPQLGMVIVIGVGGALTLHGEITAGTFLAFSTYLATTTGLARILTSLVVSAQLAKSSATRVFDVIDHPRDTAYRATDTVPGGPLGINFTDVSFAHPVPDGTNAAPLLKDLTLSIEPGECVAIVGGPGSGKSTLAGLLTGTYVPDSGSVRLTGSHRSADIADIAPDELFRSISAVDDEPFLYSTTIAANIAMAGTVDESAVRVAAQAAAADFAESLAEGYHTEIGERGLTLSGGQRQRVALARALFADPSVLVLDDATSAVDAVTEARILANLRQRGTTMLLLAHRASTLSAADRVAVLADGRIVDIGTPAELAERSAQFRRLMTTAPTSASVDASVDAAVDDDAAPEALWPNIAAAADSGRSSAVSPELARSLASLPPAGERPGGDLADLAAERDGFGLWQIVRPVRWLLAAVVVTIGIETLVGLAFPTIASRVLSANTVSTIGQITAVGVALVVIGWCVSRANTILAARAGERVLYTLRVRSYAHLQRLGLDYYERELSGRIMTRMTTDVDALSGFLQTGLSSAVVSVTTLFGVLAALVLTDWQIALAILPIFPVLAIATVVFRRVSSASYTRARELVSAVNADFQENIAGLATTRTFRYTDAATAEFDRRSDAWYRARMRSQRAVASYFPFITFCADLATAIAVGVGASHIAAGSLDPAVLVAFVLYLAILFGPVQQLTNVFDGYQQAAVGLRRIGDLLSRKSTLTDIPDTGPVTFDGAITFDDVSFSYGPDAPQVLHGLNLEIPAGSSLALVGPTGAGKSTIVKLIARFYDPTDGRVRIDETWTQDINLERYRSRLGVVPQEPHLFAGTVAENIAFGRPEATETEITDAARRVGATAMIAALPSGMRSRVTERGRGLSSGQRQLIALARAELVDPDVILLDEATATLDQATEARVLAAGAALSRRRTSVIVAHRLATAAQADQIAVVQDGAIVEIGEHTDMYNACGPYRRLWDASDRMRSATLGI